MKWGRPAPVSLEESRGVPGRRRWTGGHAGYNPIIPVRKGNSRVRGARRIKRRGGIRSEEVVTSLISQDSVKSKGWVGDLPIVVGRKKMPDKGERRGG